MRRAVHTEETKAAKERAENRRQKMVCRQHGANSMASKMIIIHLDVIQHEHYKYIIASKTKWAQIHRDTLAGGFDDAKTIKRHPSMVRTEHWCRQKEKIVLNFDFSDFQISILRSRIAPSIFDAQKSSVPTPIICTYIASKLDEREVWIRMNVRMRTCVYRKVVKKKIGNNCENDPFIDYISQLRCLVNTRTCARMMPHWNDV